MIENTPAPTMSEDMMKRSQILTILQENGYSPNNEKAVALMMSRVTRDTSTGALLGVPEAVELLKRAVSLNAQEEKPSSYHPQTVPVSRDFMPVSDEEQKTVRYYFGRTSNGGASNQLAIQNPQRYQQLKAMARKLGLVG